MHRHRRPFRVLTYSHDSYGLGHLRRSITLATAMVQRGPNVHALCLTGSPVPDIFELPERCELIKIPTIGKDAHGRYVSRRLPVSFRDIASVRCELISATVRSFRPDLLLVDHTATGPGEELLPVLRRLRNEGFNTRVALGMRDVLDAPARAREELRSNGTFEAIRAYYDEVFVYGQQEVFDPVTEYGFPADIAERTRFVGAIVPPDAVRPRETLVSPDEPHIVATAGGGEDGFALLRGIVAAMRGPMRSARIRSTVVAGPMMPATEWAALQRAVQHDPRITLVRRSTHMQELLGSADLVIGMGGYNSVYEALARRVPMLALPRRRPRAEQWERCRRLADAGHLTLLDESSLGDPHACAEAIQAALSERPEPAFGLSFDGAATTASLVLAETCVRFPAVPLEAAGA